MTPNPRLRRIFEFLNFETQFRAPIVLWQNYLTYIRDKLLHTFVCPLDDFLSLAPNLGLRVLSKVKIIETQILPLIISFEKNASL